MPDFLFQLIITPSLQLNPYEFFALSDLLGKPWSQESSLSPPSACLHFYRAQASRIPTFQLFMLVDVHRILLTHAFALSARRVFSKKKFSRARV